MQAGPTRANHSLQVPHSVLSYGSVWLHMDDYLCTCAYSSMQKSDWGSWWLERMPLPLPCAGNGKRSQISSSLSVSSHPSPVPEVLANALRDLSWDNEKLKCDGFNYNLYLHLTINYLLLIGGTSLSYNTSSRETFSPGGEQLVPELYTRLGFQSPRIWREKGGGEARGSCRRCGFLELS